MKELSITYNMAYFGETFSTVMIFRTDNAYKYCQGNVKRKKKTAKSKNFYLFFADVVCIIQSIFFKQTKFHIYSHLFLL